MTATMPRLFGKFVWCEICGQEPIRVEDFYVELLGWDTKVFSSRHFGMIPVFRNHGRRIGGVFPMTEAFVRSHWRLYVSVEDVERSAIAAERANGKIIERPTEYRDWGTRAMVEDPQGAQITLFRDERADPVDQATQVGDLRWCELWASDVEAVVPFYEAVTGCVFERREAVPGDPYYLWFGPDGMARAGLMTRTVNTAAPMWLPYFHVSDLKKAVKKSVKLGSIVQIPAHERPKLGKVAIIADPSRAYVGLVEPESRK